MIKLLGACATGSFSRSFAFNSVVHIKSVNKSLNNQPSHARQTLVKINCNERPYYLFTANVSKCGGSSNTIDDLDVQAC